MKKFRLTAFSLLLFLFCSCGQEKIENSGNEELVPAVPSGIVLTEAGNDFLSFSWEASENATSYAWKLLKGMTLVKDGSSTECAVNVNGLEEGCSYSFAVRACRGEKLSAYSPLFEATTLKSEGSENPNPGPEPGPDPIEDVYEKMMIPAAEEDGIARAFPGAEGGGMYVTGGRGGKVYHVTTLEDSSSEGSFRYAVNQKGPRTIVFDVAGTITLNSPLQIKNGDLTIAGQTAPGDGICIKGRYTNITANNIIIRFIRFRLGDEDPNVSDSDDAIWGRYCKDIILDHCSMSWCIDECASFYANENFTMQWCILAESMRSSVHSKGDHGYGGIWGGSNASFHHNMLAHHDSRNPRFDHPHIYEDHNTVPNRGVIDYRNNVVYDWGSNSSYGGEGYGAGKGTGINMVGNCYKPGPSSTDRKYFMDAYGVYAKCSSCGSNIEEGYPLMYMSDNLHSKYADISADNALGIYWHNGEAHANYGITADKPFAVKGPSGESCKVTTHSSSQTLRQVCDWAGASLSRDAVDRRVAEHALNGSGKIIDCVSSTSGKVSVADEYGFTWPLLRASDEQKAIAATDSDGDGIPDYYEALFGLDSKDANDAKAISLDKNGRYTNLEMYLHYLVKEIVAGGNEGGSYQTLD